MISLLRTLELILYQTTAAEYKLPVWWNTRPTAALVAGKTLYIAADKLVKKLDIAVS